MMDAKSWLHFFVDTNTYYEIKLLAFHGEGVSEPTVKTVHTLPRDGAGGRAEAVDSSPPPPPQNVDAKPVNDTTIIIHWTEPDFSLPIRYYTVRYTSAKKSGIALLTGGSLEEHFVETYVPSIFSNIFCVQIFQTG